MLDAVKKSYAIVIILIKIILEAKTKTKNSFRSG